MRVLDLFCGAGAVSLGLARAGFEVVGVDIEPQPNYPFAFIQADATRIDQRLLQFFDAIWASPPCLRDTVMGASARREQRAHGSDEHQHPDLIAPTRAMLKASGVPYVIENVMGADLIDPVVLCGFMFGLGATTSDGTRYHLDRKRKFEASFPIPAPAFERKGPVIGVYGGHVRCRAASAGGRLSADFHGEDKPRLMREAMGIPPGQTMDEMSQAIPPRYAQHIGVHLRTYLQAQRAEGI